MSRITAGIYTLTWIGILSLLTMVTYKAEAAICSMHPKELRTLEPHIATLIDNREMIATAIGCICVAFVIRGCYKIYHH